MSGSVGIILVVLILAGVACLRGGAGGIGALMLLGAIVLFITTPMGEGLPQATGDFFSSVNSVTTSTVNHSHGGGS